MCEDSCSIESQKSLLEEYACDQGFGNCQFFVDDWYTGTNYDRPDFQRLIRLVESGDVGIIIVKDLSRLGREYLQTGYYTEVAFSRGKMSRALNQLMVVFWYRGFQNMFLTYTPKLAPALDFFTATLEFVKIELDNAYFEISLKEASESKLWSKKILHASRLSALYENLKKDYPLNTVISFYSKNGYMTGVLEKILGIKGSREVVARYELSRIGTYSDLPIL